MRTDQPHRGWGRVSLLAKLLPLPGPSFGLKGFCHPLARPPATSRGGRLVCPLPPQQREVKEYVIFRSFPVCIYLTSRGSPPLGLLPCAQDYCSRWPQPLCKRNQDRGSAGAQSSPGPLAKFRFPSRRPGGPSLTHSGGSADPQG